MGSTLYRVLLVIAIFGVLISCQSMITQPVFRQAATSDPDFPKYYVMLFNGKRTILTWNDKDSDFPIDSQQEKIKLDVGDNLIDRLWYAKYGDDLIVVYSITDFEMSGGRVARIDMKSKKPAWTINLSGFNPGEPIIHDRYLYVTSIGSVGKIDLETGEYIWKLGGLYDRKTQDFNDFQKPVLNGERVVFQGNNPSSDTSKRVEVEDGTGKILGIFDTDKRLATALTPTLESSASCTPSDLGSGKNLDVTLQTGCYYHFKLPCSVCKIGNVDSIVIHYTGDNFTITLPEGSAWQANQISGLGEVCSMGSDSPSKLPWFLILPGAELMFPCG